MKYFVITVIFMILFAIGMIGMYRAGYHDVKVVDKIMFTYRQTDEIFNLIRDHELGKINIKSDVFKTRSMAFDHKTHDDLIDEIKIPFMVNDDDASVMKNLRRMK